MEIVRSDFLQYLQLNDAQFRVHHVNGVQFKNRTFN